MIFSTLVDVPGFGAEVYGGHAVYDTDAKRQFLNVHVPNVYSAEAADEMTRGALASGRAMVGVAVTGHAAPILTKAECAARNVTWAENLADLGTVYYGVGHRSQADDPFAFKTRTRTFHICDSGHATTVEYCAWYRGNATESEQGYVPDELLVATRRAIRMDTVIAAFEETSAYLDEVSPSTAKAGEVFGVLPLAPYDGLYTGCQEPSSIIAQHLRGHGDLGVVTAACPVDVDIVWPAADLSPLPVPTATPTAEPSPTPTPATSAYDDIASVDGIFETILIAIAAMFGLLILVVVVMGARWRRQRASTRRRLLATVVVDEEDAARL